MCFIMNDNMLKSSESWMERKAAFMNNLIRKPKSYYLMAALGLMLHLAAALPLYRMVDRVLAWLLFVILLRQIFMFVRHARLLPIVMLISLQFYVMFGLAQFGQDSLRL